MNCCTLSKGGCELFDRYKKYAGEVSLSFQLELNTRDFSSVPTDKSIKDRGQANVGAVPRKLLAGLDLYEIFPLFWCGGHTPEACPSILGAPCVI
jgi:hypothetical protein